MGDVSWWSCIDRAPESYASERSMSTASLDQLTISGTSSGSLYGSFYGSSCADGGGNLAATADPVHSSVHSSMHSSVHSSVPAPQGGKRVVQLNKVRMTEVRRPFR